MELERRVAATEVRRDRVHALLPHRVVREPERLRDIGIGQRRDSGTDPPRGLPRALDALRRGLLETVETRARIRHAALLGVDPCLVGVDEWRDRRAGLAGALRL